MEFQKKFFEKIFFESKTIWFQILCFNPFCHIDDKICDTYK